MKLYISIFALFSTFIKIVPPYCFRWPWGKWLKYLTWITYNNFSRKDQQISSYVHVWYIIMYIHYLYEYSYTGGTLCIFLSTIFFTHHKPWMLWGVCSSILFGFYKAGHAFFSCRAFLVVRFKKSSTWTFQKGHSHFRPILLKKKTLLPYPLIGSIADFTIPPAPPPPS